MTSSTPLPARVADLPLALLLEGAERDATLHDAARLQAVRELLLDCPDAEEAVHDLLVAAAERLGAATAMLGAVLDDMHLVVAAHGLDGWVAEARALPAEWSFCATTVRRRAPHLLEDAAAEPAWADNPLVHVDGIRSYAGAPLLDAEGQALGALCVVGDAPRAWTAADAAVLADLAEEAVARLEQRRRTRAEARGPA